MLLFGYIALLCGFYAHFFSEPITFKDPAFVVTDNRRGDRICLGKDGRGCGSVVQDHIEVQGADRRNFEGEDVSKLWTIRLLWMLLFRALCYADINSCLYIKFNYAHRIAASSVRRPTSFSETQRTWRPRWTSRWRVRAETTRPGSDSRRPTKMWRWVSGIILWLLLLLTSLYQLRWIILFPFVEGESSWVLYEPF